MGAFTLSALRTWLAVIRQPGRFFSGGKPATAAAPFALLLYVLSLGSAAVLNLWALGHHPHAIALGGIAGALVGLVAMLLWVGVGGTLWHGGLRLSGAHTGSLGDTWRCLCYASAPLVVLHVPFVGAIPALAGMLALGVIGMRCVHRVSVPRALFGLSLSLSLLAVVFLAGCRAFGSTAVQVGEPGAGLLRGDRLLLLRPWHDSAEGRPLFIWWSADDQGIVRLRRIGSTLPLRSP